MLNVVPQSASLLRHELRARNMSYAITRQLPHVTSYGEAPVVVYQQSDCGRHHGNFISASYRAILRRPEWRKRLLKVHSSGKRSLPRGNSVWRELDSSMSSDALLMNTFCYPGVTKGRDLTLMLGTDVNDVPEFGFRPRVPLKSGMIDRTEVDMRLGSVLFEAKLSEADFQSQHGTIVEGYRDLKVVFEWGKLPRTRKRYASYQLLRNVLAAQALGLSFCVLLDARRGDLMEDWYEIMACLRPTALRTRCKVLTWQELATVLPARLQQFLDLKYGIG